MNKKISIRRIITLLVVSLMRLERNISKIINNIK